VALLSLVLLVACARPALLVERRLTRDGRDVIAVSHRPSSPTVAADIELSGWSFDERPCFRWDRERMTAFVDGVAADPLQTGGRYRPPAVVNRTAVLWPNCEPATFSPGRDGSITLLIEGARVHFATGPRALKRLP
jgi:hypothetical protein